LELIDRIQDFDMAAVYNPESYYSTLYKEAFSIVRDPLVYLFPAYTRIPSKWIPYRNRAQVANERLRKIFYEVIEEKKAAPSTSSDLLSLMIKANHSESDIAYLTDDELISNLSTFFVAGKIFVERYERTYVV
jgi:cytochrome P450